MKNKYLKTVQFLEGLQIMPKTMPGLDKIKKALTQTDWYGEIDPEKVIVVAGTNGKGSTCAMLEALLLDANQSVGFYSSPHLVSTTERIRTNGESISEENFVKVFEQCETLIKDCELSHFEALTLMAGHFYFSKNWNQKLDYIIFEVGLGGTYDATNAFPHRYSVITPLSIDHSNILGKTLPEIAKNKFGIIQSQNTVIHQHLEGDVQNLFQFFLKQTDSHGIEVSKGSFELSQISNETEYILNSKWGAAKLSLLGQRAVENALTALTTMAALGFDPSLYLKSLSQVNWPGRMQKIKWPGAGCPVYLSGDHNPQGIQSLVEILKNFSWENLFLVIGIGVDKEADEMLSELLKLKNSQLYLTVTPFKGRLLDQYPETITAKAQFKNENPVITLQKAAEAASEKDLIVVTGSLYLVGEILKFK